MKTLKHTFLPLLVLTVLLTAGVANPVSAQSEPSILHLFDKYGSDQGVTRTELNGAILDEFRMSAYKSLVFKNINPYRKEVERELKNTLDQLVVRKSQVVTESDTLRSAYYQMTPVKRKRTKLNRYLLYKTGKGTTATLVYIEGKLDERQFMELLFLKK